MTNYLEQLHVDQLSHVLSFLSPVESNNEDNVDLCLAATCKGLRDQVEDIDKRKVKDATGITDIEGLANLRIQMAGLTHHTRMPYRLVLRCLKAKPVAWRTTPLQIRLTCGLPGGMVAALSHDRTQSSGLLSILDPKSNALLPLASCVHEITSIQSNTYIQEWVDKLSVTTDSEEGVAFIVLHRDNWDQGSSNPSEIVAWKWDSNTKDLKHWFTRVFESDIAATVDPGKGVIYHTLRFQSNRIYLFHVNTPFVDVPLMIADAKWARPGQLSPSSGRDCVMAIVGRFLIVRLADRGIYVLDRDNSLEQVHFLEMVVVQEPQLIASPQGLIAADGDFQDKKGLHFFSLDFQTGSLLYRCSIGHSEVMNNGFERFVPLGIQGSVVYAHAVEARTINAFDVSSGGTKLRSFPVKGYSNIRDCRYWRRGFLLDKDGILLLLGILDSSLFRQSGTEILRFSL